MISWRRSIYIFAMISLAGFYHTSTGIHLNRQTLTGNILGWRYIFFNDIINASSLGSDFFFGANFKGARKRIREIMHIQWSKHPTTEFRASPNIEKTFPLNIGNEIAGLFSTLLGRAFWIPILGSKKRIAIPKVEGDR